MRVIDLNGKKKKIDSIKVIQHDVSDAVNGGSVLVEYVEVEVVGKQSNWTEWWLLKEFKHNNPNFDLEA